MGKHPLPPHNASDNTGNELRTYPAPWKGQLVFACSKCRKKLKRSEVGSSLISLKKELKKRAKLDKSDLKLRVVSVSCLKMCPKDGVTVCTQEQLGNNQCAILRTRNDLDQLYHDINRHISA
jgi:predicted metal-binding protein